MLNEDKNIEHTHILYSVKNTDRLTLTKIGVALINKQGEYILDINKNYASGDILIYKK
ncbi:hypothetical protein [Enterobacter kobei]|uniref:hypothetical protein n=1 Tax=Enterobacter kobei TaxID=208224 RepID=UPI0028740F60|nr:hypothetical protein [Enterobacter kobei]MDS0027217.1 hypothetical protein [Enterobacter kobei]